MKEKEEKDHTQEALDHYLLKIIDAKLAYTLFKTLYSIRFEGTVGPILAKKYVWTQQECGGFFTLIEHCAVIAFIMKISHCFDDKDRQDRPLTLKDIDGSAYSNFVSQSDNKKFIKKIRDIRDRRIAHYDKTIEINQILPPFEEIDSFFKRLEGFYDGLAKEKRNASVIRQQDQDLKNNLDVLLQNLFVGKKIRLLNSELKIDWQENEKNISKNKSI